MKLYCPVCKEPLKVDHDQDDECENANYHDEVGFNYKCKKHGSIMIKVRDRE